MEMFILKLVGIICVTIFSISIVIARKDDLDIWSVVIASLLELLCLIVVYVPMDTVMNIISELVK